MPHQRKREILPILLKRLKLWPVVGLVGARQTGKSVLLRDLLLPKIDGKYITLDSLTERARAQNTPEAFTEPSDQKIKIIDEVQKAGDLFDSIKYHVDQNRRPGMFVISGSTEFSKLTGIRESLTGRIGILHLYPMTLRELYGKEVGNYFSKKAECKAILSLEEYEKKVTRGGMPGLCFLRDSNEFSVSCDMWLETTCYRDLQQVQGSKLDGGLGLAILMEIAKAEEATLAHLAKRLRKDARVIGRYLKALEAILVVYRIEPHRSGVGKALYTLCDAGFMSHLGATPANVARTHVLFEALAYFENQGLGRPQVYYYRNQKTSRVPLIFDWGGKRNSPASLAIQIQPQEVTTRGDMDSLHAFQKKVDQLFRLLILTHTANSYFEKDFEIHPLRG